METGGREERREGRKLGRSEVAGARGVYLGSSGWGAHSGRGSPAPAAMDEERALYIVRAGEAGAIERVLRDYSDKVKSSGPGRAFAVSPRAALGACTSHPPQPPSFWGCALLSPPRKRFRLGRVCAPSLSHPCILHPHPAPISIHTVAPTPPIPGPAACPVVFFLSVQVTPPESVDAPLPSAPLLDAYNACEAFSPAYCRNTCFSA